MTKEFTPLNQLFNSLLDEKDVQLWIKRNDLTHPELQGNKWRNLK